MKYFRLIMGRMICQKCNYLMSDFDKECPRCHGHGIKKESVAAKSSAIPPAATASTPPAAPVAVATAAVNTTTKGCCGCLTLIVLLAIISSIFGDHTPKETVRNSEWDSSVVQVQDYLKRNLNDANSVQYVEWSKVNIAQNPTSYKYWVRCKYRAKNALGAYVLANQIFYLDEKGEVVDVKDLE